MYIQVKLHLSIVSVINLSFCFQNFKFVCKLNIALGGCVYFSLSFFLVSLCNRVINSTIQNIHDDLVFNRLKNNFSTVNLYLLIRLRFDTGHCDWPWFNMEVSFWRTQRDITCIPRTFPHTVIGRIQFYTIESCDYNMYKETKPSPVLRTMHTNLHCNCLTEPWNSTVSSCSAISSYVNNFVSVITGLKDRQCFPTIF